MRVTQLLEVPSDIVEQYWELYDQAFEEMKTASPCRQYLRREEFYEEMCDHRIIKFILWDDDSEPVAMSLVATDLEAVPWISPPYFEKKFSEHYRKGIIYYFGALLTTHHDRQDGHAEYLLAELVNFVVGNDGIACFDCGGFNNVFLPTVIREATEKQANVLCEQLDTQTYYAYTSGGFKPGFNQGLPFGARAPVS